jgi:xanthine dehydrogenase accessory factor
MIDTNDSSPEVLLKIDELIDKGETFAVALVLKAEGSTPRKAGVRAVIFETGKIFGTLGGGIVEAQTQSRAVESCKSKKAVLFDVQLYGEDRQGDIPICGGSMTILIDPDAAKNKVIFKQAAEAIKNRTKGVLITTINGNLDLHIHYEWRTQDSIPSEPVLRDSGLVTRDSNCEPRATFVEPVVPKPLLVVAGGGHIGQALAIQGSLIGFDIIVLDDRPEFTNPELFPKEAKMICGNIASELEKIPINKDTYIVIVTRGHKDDASALEACIKKPFNYIGMIGSRRKVALIRENFIQSGLCSAEQFDKIFSPIGLNIGAVTVPEIAVSITAELIAVRRMGITHKQWTDMEIL